MAKVVVLDLWTGESIIAGYTYAWGRYMIVKDNYFFLKHLYLKPIRGARSMDGIYWRNTVQYCKCCE
jgi:hypothetical protein